MQELITYDSFTGAGDTFSYDKLIFVQNGYLILTISLW